MKIILLVATVFLFSCKKEGSSGDETGPESETEQLKFHGFDKVCNFSEHQPIHFIHSSKGSEVYFRIGREPLEIRSLMAKDRQGRNVTYEVTGCSPYTSDIKTDIYDRFCEEAVSFTSDGVLQIQSLWDISPDVREKVVENEGRLTIHARIGNGVPDNTLEGCDKHFVGLSLQIFNVDTTDDIKDTQYLPNELDDLPEMKRLVIEQMAFHGRVGHTFGNPEIGKGGSGSSSAWYLGSSDGVHFMASSHHSTFSKTLRKHPIYFPYLGLSGTVEKAVYLNKYYDFAIYAAKFNEPEIASTLREMPIDVEYVPSTDDPLAAIGFSAMNSPLMWPGVEENSNCRIIKGELIVIQKGSIVMPGYPTGCQVWNGDSGGAVLNRDSTRVVGSIAKGLFSRKHEFMSNVAMFEQHIKEDLLGLFLVPLSVIREDISKRPESIPTEYRDYILKRFNIEQGTNER